MIFASHLKTVKGVLVEIPESATRHIAHMLSIIFKKTIVTEITYLFVIFIHESQCKTITFKETLKLTVNSLEGLKVYKHACMRVYSPCDVGMAKSCRDCTPFTSHAVTGGQGVSHL